MTDRTGTAYIEPNTSPVPASVQTQLDRLAELVERLEKQMALMGTPLPPPVTFTSGGTYVPTPPPAPAPDAAGKIIHANVVNCQSLIGMRPSLTTEGWNQVFALLRKIEELALGLASHTDRVVTDAMVEAALAVINPHVIATKRVVSCDLMEKALAAALAEAGKEPSDE